MGKDSRIRPTDLSRESDKIRPSTVKDLPVSFNFKSLTQKEDKFRYDNGDSEYFIKLLDRLKDVSTMTKSKMMLCTGKPLRCHRIDFNDRSVTESSLGIPGRDLTDDSYQFSLSSNEHGRVHGYFIDNVYYLVWLDRKHELYSRRD